MTLVPMAGRRGDKLSVSASLDGRYVTVSRIICILDSGATSATRCDLVGDVDP